MRKIRKPTSTTLFLQNRETDCVADRTTLFLRNKETGVDDMGIEPMTSRLQSERSTPELIALCVRQDSNLCAFQQRILRPPP